jgi:hypothetical protein
MCIAVMGDDKKCPDDATFSPKTYAAMLKMNAFKRDVLTPPDWAFLLSVMLLLCALIAVAVLVSAYMLKRDWHQTWIPAIIYQQRAYSRVENSNPEDKRAIVSINTEASSFMFRAGQGGAGNVMDEVDEQMMQVEAGGEKKDKKGHKKKDLTIKDVEKAKDDLAAHLKEIRKLARERESFKEDEDDLEALDDDEESSDAEDDRELNRKIAALKKLLAQNSKMLKGEHDDGDDDEGDFGLI